VDSVFEGNQALSGSGATNRSRMRLRSVLIINNHATAEGGGICNGGSLTLNDVVFADNTPDDLADC
jgi:hypothetical protein